MLKIDLIKRACEVRNFKFLSLQNDTVNFICSEGHVVEQHIETFRKTGCPFCSGNKISEKDSIKKINEQGFLVDYSKWNGKRTKVMLKCENGHEFEMKIGSIKRNNFKINCPQCEEEKRIEKFKLQLSEENYELIQIDEDRDGFTFKCNKEHISHMFFSNWFNGQRCGKCWNEINYSKQEKELLEFIKSIIPNEEIVENDREIIKPKELDIYIPSRKIGIEFNGAYWHSDRFVSKNYHQKKYLICKEKGIRLIQVMSYEWENKQEIVKSIIKNALGCIENKIYARKCEIRELNNIDFRQFLEENHIQGYSVSKYRYGLLFGNELVACMSFGKNRFTYGTELIRFAVKKNYSVIGGFDKLLKHYLRTHNEDIISYCDVRWFSGEGYLKNGFEKISLTSPNYIYFKGENSFSRFKFQKHRLKYVLDDFNSNLSEDENVKRNGYLKVYDAGNIKLCLKGAQRNGI